MINALLIAAKLVSRNTYFTRMIAFTIPVPGVALVPIKIWNLFYWQIPRASFTNMD